MSYERVADKRQRAIDIWHALDEAYPESTCALHHNSPFQLLVATVLSAQTTDRAVNQATAHLFAAYPTAQALAEAPLSQVQRIIGGIGLWRAKSANIIGLSRGIVAQFSGEVPQSVDALTTLPGVGRKTATAVLGTAFGLDAGMTVDTHMLRINHHLKLSTRKDPVKMAKELEALLPKAKWNHYTHMIIDHGRVVCVARRPRCGVCPLSQYCPSAGKAEIGYAERNDAQLPASAKNLSWL